MYSNTAITVLSNSFDHAISKTVLTSFDPTKTETRFKEIIKDAIKVQSK
jgi:hypothetical protein